MFSHIYLKIKILFPPETRDMDANTVSALFYLKLQEGQVPPSYQAIQYVQQICSLQ